MRSLVVGSWNIVDGGCAKNVNRLFLNSLITEQKNVYKFYNNFPKQYNCAKKLIIKHNFQTYSHIIYTYIYSIFKLLKYSFYTLSTIPITTTINLINNKER